MHLKFSKFLKIIFKVEKKPEPEKAEEPKAEDKKEQGEPMETDAAAPKDDKMETEEKKDEGDAKGVIY